MSGFDELSPAKSRVQYQLSQNEDGKAKWIPFKALKDRVIYILDAWSKDGRFGPEARFIFAASNGHHAELFGSSTGATTVRHQLLEAAKRGLLPRYAQVVQMPSDTPAGFYWFLKDLGTKIDEPDHTLIIAAVEDAKIVPDDPGPTGVGSSDISDDELDRYFSSF
ncbi:hypothetical protein TPY_2714 [Sulfobacillus acidophilus TPY]|uniref:Uncharacterized protein n=1 Tax=Sulfobacillus acidophilus (strain ATCC 700253 / DSM 10332 / NAL) TaxID=679936 RepID=G8TUL9_SULAD|nr:hypothetical protein TPY_2714 [Sulfobacillus acidophilus TPY]AEW04666.1 hypothetical protein Sulac_1166 [Sulfobacillus acidophilus DSM 10332]